MQREGHSAPVDWWALGVVTYELVHGYTPFSSQGNVADDPLELYRRITHPSVKVDYSSCAAGALSAAALSFLKRLLRRKQQIRLGAGGAHEVREHAFLAPLRWEALEARDASAWHQVAPLPRRAATVTPLRRLYGESVAAPVTEQQQAPRQQQLQGPPPAASPLPAHAAAAVAATAAATAAAAVVDSAPSLPAKPLPTARDAVRLWRGSGERQPRVPPLRRRNFAPAAIAARGSGSGSRGDGGGGALDGAPRHFVGTGDDGAREGSAAPSSTTRFGPHALVGKRLEGPSPTSVRLVEHTFTITAAKHAPVKRHAVLVGVDSEAHESTWEFSMI